MLLVIQLCEFCGKGFVFLRGFRVLLLWVAECSYILSYFLTNIFFLYLNFKKWSVAVEALKLMQDVKYKISEGLYKCWWSEKIRVINRYLIIFCHNRLMVILQEHDRIILFMVVHFWWVCFIVCFHFNAVYP